MPPLHPSPRASGHGWSRISVALPKSPERNRAEQQKIHLPVNCGAKPCGHPDDNFFRLGIPEDSLILAPITGAALTPVYPPFPPYLVFDSGTRTIA